MSLNFLTIKARNHFIFDQEYKLNQIVSIVNLVKEHEENSPLPFKSKDLNIINNIQKKSITFQ